MTSQISDADPSELSDLLEVDGAPLLSLTDPSRCLGCWRWVILMNVERIFEEFGVFWAVRSASPGCIFNGGMVPSARSSTNLSSLQPCGQCAKLQATSQMKQLKFYDPLAVCLERQPNSYLLIIPQKHLFMRHSNSQFSFFLCLNDKTHFQ